MNRQQREANRRTARHLHQAILDNHLCENCGERGAHWVNARWGLSLANLMQTEPEGFWVCHKYYAVDGTRIAP